MEPSLLAGPVEFSPAEIAVILALLAALFVALTAPGWAVVAYAARCRRTASRPGRPAWGATLGGAFGGLLLSCGTAALLGALMADVGGRAWVVVVLGSWVACWAVAYALAPRPRREEGWGR